MGQRADCSRHPDDLYLNGIQRQSFLPAIELIKEHFQVVDLDSPTGQLSAVILKIKADSRLP
jgi:hypothetical protein